MAEFIPPPTKIMVRLEIQMEKNPYSLNIWEKFFGWFWLQHAGNTGEDLQKRAAKKVKAFFSFVSEHF